MSLDATPGGADANSFLTRAEADAIIGNWLYADAWTAATATKRDQALVMATLRIASVTCWTGTPATTTQALPWPRSGMLDRNGNAIATDVIPRELKQATARLAIKLAESDVTADAGSLAEGIESVRAGPISVTFRDDASRFQGHPADRYTSESVLPNDVLAMLVPSWLCPAATSTTSGMIFEVLG